MPRAFTAYERRHHFGISSVAASEAVWPELPHIARPGHRDRGCLGDVLVRGFTLDIDLRAIGEAREQSVQIRLGEPRDGEIEILGGQPF